MNHFSPAAFSATPASFHSLVDWLVLSGISYEVGEDTAYEALSRQMARQQQESSLAQPAASVRPAAAASKAPAASLNLNLPEFASIEELNAFLLSYKELGLTKTASSCVLGQGNPAPKLLVITDMPEDQEDRSGQAFSSLSNQMIRKALGFAGFEAESLYFTYLSKWRPPGKRALSPPEVTICGRLLEQEIKLLRPKAILALGESTLRVIWPDSARHPIKPPFVNNISYHGLNYETPFFASQKSEFLVKNAVLKKSFWFSLLDLAATIRTEE